MDDLSEPSRIDGRCAVATVTGPSVAAPSGPRALRPSSIPRYETACEFLPVDRVECVVRCLAHQFDPPAPSASTTLDRRRGPAVGNSGRQGVEISHKQVQHMIAPRRLTMRCPMGVGTTIATLATRHCGGGHDGRKQFEGEWCTDG